MSKTHLPLNKEVILIAIMAVVIISLLVVNVVFSLSKVVSVYLQNPPSTNKQLIDAEAVNQAIDILNTEWHWQRIFFYARLG